MVAVAEQEFDQPVLARLEARGLAELRRGSRVYSLGVIVRSTSQALLSCSKMRDTRASILKAGCSSVVGDRAARGAELVDGKLHPQLGGLVLDDEQHLVMRVGERMLRAEDRVQSR